MKTVSAIKLVNTNDPTYNKLTVGEGGNRTPTDRSVLRLATSIGNCNLLEYRPILVKKETKKKGNYVIIDGQTRYLACQHLGYPFYMQEVDKDITEGMLSILNTNQSNWTLTNFGDYWSKQPRKKKAYNKYMEYYRTHKVTHGILLSIWRGETRRCGNNQDFKNGKLEWNTQIQNNVDDMLDYFVDNTYDDLVTVDSKGTRNGSIRITKAQYVKDGTMSRRVGSMLDNCTNIHSVEDLKKAEWNIKNNE